MSTATDEDRHRAAWAKQRRKYHAKLDALAARPENRARRAFTEWLADEWGLTWFDGNPQFAVPTD